MATETVPGFAHAVALTQAALEARAYIRGGLDPAYDDPAARDAYARQLTHVDPDVAASFLAGWDDHHEDTDPPITAWHRLIGATVVQVGREAAA